MASKKHYVVISVLLLALLIGMTLSQGFEWVWAQVGLDSPRLFDVQQFSLTNVLGFGLAASAAIFVFSHKKTFHLGEEIVDELFKVTWPSREETGNATVVVIVTVIVCSVFLGAFDAVWLALTDFILGIGGIAG